MLNKESNSYTIIFSVVMVILVGVALAFVAQFTAPYQEKNIVQEKQQNILSAINVEVSRKEAEEQYSQYIKQSVVFDATGTVVEGQDAFNIDLAGELKKPEEEQLFPLFIAEKDGKKLYILPMRGKGLWDAIWGYISVEEDGSTIAGAVFAHKGETPGLGAEISQKAFQAQFVGKKILDVSGNFMSIAVVKPGKNPPGYEHGVDGISGGTITSTGVDAMLKKYLKTFSDYISKNQVAAMP